MLEASVDAGAPLLDICTASSSLGLRAVSLWNFSVSLVKVPLPAKVEQASLNSLEDTVGRSAKPWVRASIVVEVEREFGY